MAKIGVWIIGTYGSVAAAVMAGAKIIGDKISKPTGLITELPELSNLDFIPLDQIVFGGHEIRRGSLLKSMNDLFCEAHISHGRTFIENVQDHLESIEKDVCMGTSIGCSEEFSDIENGPSPNIDSQPLKKITDTLGNDITNFKRKHNLQTVIVINLSSTESQLCVDAPFETRKDVENAIKNDKRDLIRPCMLYAYAALKGGFPFINFTPSVGPNLSALTELARQQKVPVAGDDGKTGETLIKSVLGLAFKYRALKVLSWQGYNILGNMDGKVLSNPENKRTKLESKDSVLPPILGYKPHSHIGIDYVPSLSDWKVAWDFIHFEGFLGTKMSLQFIWQGCDSMLAAPLVLDLIRLTDLARRRGDCGPLAHLALFFKRPLGTDVTDLPAQWDLLMNYLENI